MKTAQRFPGATCHRQPMIRTVCSGISLPPREVTSVPSEPGIAAHVRHDATMPVMAPMAPTNDATPARANVGR